MQSSFVSSPRVTLWAVLDSMRADLSYLISSLRDVFQHLSSLMISCRYPFRSSSSLQYLLLEIESSILLDHPPRYPPLPIFPLELIRSSSEVHPISSSYSFLKYSLAPSISLISDSKSAFSLLSLFIRILQSFKDSFILLSSSSFYSSALMILLSRVWDLLIHSIAISIEVTSLPITYSALTASIPSLRFLICIDCRGRGWLRGMLRTVFSLMGGSSSIPIENPKGRGRSLGAHSILT